MEFVSFTKLLLVKRVYDGCVAGGSVIHDVPKLCSRYSCKYKCMCVVCLKSAKMVEDVVFDDNHGSGGCFWGHCFMPTGQSVWNEMD